MLQTTIVIDYQNMHNVAFKTWGEYLGYANLEQSLLHPYRLGQAIVDKRNSLMQEGYEPASLNRVLVYRGLPDPRYDPELNAYNLKEKAVWERCSCVSVTHRPLRYWGYVKNAVGGYDRLNDSGKKEKGIDVLCALAVVAEAQSPSTDLVILASHDTDLSPALELAASRTTTKIGTVQCYNPVFHHTPKDLGHNLHLWNTRLDKDVFLHSLDPTDYSNSCDIFFSRSD